MGCLAQRNQTIDIFRIVFNLGIFLNHLNQIKQPDENPAIITRYGFLGVEFFFIVSGYLMASNAAKQSVDNMGHTTISFLSRKLFHILPYYSVAWALGFVVLHMGEDIGKSLSDLLLSIPAFLQLQIYGFPVYQVLGPTWYISAMLAAMLLIYPLMIKFKERYTLILAPIAVLVLYGYLFRVVGNLATIQPLEGGVFYTGLMRGIAGISLGCICYEASQTIRNLKLTKRANRVLVCVEWAGFLLAFAAMQSQNLLRPDFFVVLLLGIAVTASFSKKQTYNALIDKIDFGLISLSLYLADTPARNLVCQLLPEASRNERIIPCTIICICATVAVYCLGRLLQKLFSRFSIYTKSRLIEGQI